MHAGPSEEEEEVAGEQEGRAPRWGKSKAACLGKKKMRFRGEKAGGGRG